MDQKRYKDFMDMFDGGGAGQMGDTFQGGGLFSLIANMIADPYGSKDPERRKERMKALGLLDTGMDMSTPPAAPTVAPVVQPKQMSTPPLRGPAGMTAPMTAPPLSGPAGMPMPNNVQAQPMSGPAGIPMSPGEQFMNQVRGAANRQPAGTPTSMYEPSPEDMMRQKMINAGYDPTGLGVHEMQLFIDAMGL